MIKMTLEIDGMACSMCASHINDAIRANFKVNKVNTSHTSGRSVIIADTTPNQERLCETINNLGYTVKNVSVEPYVKKKGILGFFTK